MPATDGFSVRKSPKPFLKKRQIVERVDNVLLPTIGAAMYCHYLLPSRYPHAVYKSLQGELFISIVCGNTITVGLEAHQAQGVGLHRTHLAARIGMPRQG